MKISAFNLVLASLVAGTSAKTYYNRMIAKDTTNILGPNPRYLVEYPDDEIEDDMENKGRGLKGYARRRAEGEIPVPPPFEGSGDTADDDEDAELQFYEARDLDFFKKGIDPNDFEWVNPDEIVPGEITCGFLKPPLGSLDDVIYPRIEVYICMRFANIQPAKKGNMFVHCGGPGSLSDCTLLMEPDLGEDNLNDYNVLSIDQRGMGRSWPSFAHEECSTSTFERAENGTIIGEQQPEAWLNISGFTTEEDILAYLPPIKDRVERCWTCTTCDFFLEAEQITGNVTRFHFLEFSGTRQLAEDMFRMMLLLDAPTLHLYGISYGTSVMSTFATIFPSYTGLFILDSNISPNPDHYHNAYTGAVGVNDRIDYIIYSCSAANLFEPGTCPVEDMRKCIGDINKVFDEQFGIAAGAQAEPLNLVIQTFLTNFTVAQDICDIAASGDGPLLEQALMLSAPEVWGVTQEAEVMKRQLDWDPISRPTSDFDVYGNPDYSIINAGSQIAITMVRAQDRAGPIYDEDRFAKQALAVNDLYSGAGTGGPVSFFVAEYSIGYYWPKSVPIPPAGSPYISGIIIGVLYDSNTPYVWTQEMRAAFKFTNLITNQGTFHGIGSWDPSCQRHVVDYLQNGYPNFVDGQICGADFAGAGDFLGVFGVSFAKR